jgi:hypothetical protein
MLKSIHEERTDTYEIEQVQAYAFLIPVIWRRHLQGAYGAFANNPAAWLYQTTPHSLIVVFVATAKLHFTIPYFCRSHFVASCRYPGRASLGGHISHAECSRSDSMRI